MAAVIDNSSSIERLPNQSFICCRVDSLYLAVDQVEMVDDDDRNFIIFFNSKFALQAVRGQD